MLLEVARSTKPTDSSACCIVAPPVGPTLMSRRPAQDNARAIGRSRRRRRCLRGAPQLGDGGEDGAPVAVEERDDAPHGELLPGEAVSIGCSGRLPRFAWRRGACSGRDGRSVRGGCGGPVLDVEVVYLGLVVEVVVRHVRVVGRRRDHEEPERGPGRRRGRPAVDVLGQGEPGGGVDVRGVDPDGGQVVEGGRGFTRAGLGLEDDSVGGRHTGCPVGPLAVRRRPRARS